MMMLGLFFAFRCTVVGKYHTYNKRNVFWAYHNEGIFEGNAEMSEYIYHNSTPGLLLECARTPAMQRLRGVGMDQPHYEAARTDAREHGAPDQEVPSGGYLDT